MAHVVMARVTRMRDAIRKRCKERTKETGYKHLHSYFIVILQLSAMN